ncbi:hypothetical protein XACM_2607 [Xanthomonas euvesicatoria pv. citrumelo F1]|nr:hypothetical protein XACM_2607 [Xanthomonas euvesicatoria pv. citrumelo F1]
MEPQAVAPILDFKAVIQSRLSLAARLPPAGTLHVIAVLYAPARAAVRFARIASRIAYDWTTI